MAGLSMGARQWQRKIRYSRVVETGPAVGNSLSTRRRKVDVQKVVFMLMVKEMDRAIAFYRDVIGLELRLHEENWAELGHDDAVVALHGGGNGEYRSTDLGFTVADIAEACEEVRYGGGRTIRDPEERAGEGIILAHLVDPEGNGFNLSQSAR